MKKRILFLAMLVIGIAWLSDCAFAQGQWVGPYYAENVGGTITVRGSNGRAITVLQDPRYRAYDGQFYPTPPPPPQQARAAPMPLPPRDAGVRPARRPVQSKMQYAAPRPTQRKLPGVTPTRPQYSASPPPKPQPAPPPPPRPPIKTATVKTLPPAQPQPAIQVPAVKTEKGVVQAPNPRPTPDFPVAVKKEEPTAEIKRNSRRLDGPAVVVNQENIHVNVMLSASNNLGRKVALEVKPGEYVLMRGTLTGWEAVQKDKVKEVPPGYEIVRGREANR